MPLTVREARKARGITQQQLAERAHISIWLATELDRQNHTPRSAAIRYAVADALGVSVSDLWPAAHPSA